MFQYWKESLEWHSLGLEDSLLSSRSIILSIISNKKISKSQWSVQDNKYKRQENK